MGIEFAGSIVGMIFLGWFIDKYAGTGTRWTMICGIVGILGGGYNFIKRAREHTKRQEDAYKVRHSNKTDDTDKSNKPRI